MGQTIGKKKKSKHGEQFRKPHKKQLKAVVTRGIKRVAESVLNGKYDISNKDILKKYFNKNGSLKKSALRTNRQRDIYNEEVKKAKEEIKQQRKEQAEKKRKLREQLKKDREEKKQERLKEKIREQKKKEKRKKQVETYKEGGHSFNLNTYETFVDILDDVYDEVALLFYDSDQVMQWLEDDHISKEQIKQLLLEINKSKVENLTDTEKQLLKSGDYKLDREERDNLADITAEIIELSLKQNDLNPNELFIMREQDPMKYARLKAKYAR